MNDNYLINPPWQRILRRHTNTISCMYENCKFANHEKSCDNSMVHVWPWLFSYMVFTLCILDNATLIIQSHAVIMCVLDNIN